MKNPLRRQCNERRSVPADKRAKIAAMELMQSKEGALEVLRLPAPSGAPARAPLVFLHEGLGSVALWGAGRGGSWPEQVCAALGRASLVYSRRGYGQSEAIVDVRGGGRHPADYMHRHAWETLPDLLAQCGLSRPVLVGHSDGGSIALLHAARFPTTACVVMAPHVMVEPISLEAIEAARAAYLQGDLRARLARFHADVDSAFWQWNDVWLSPAFASFDIRAECQGIGVPVLAIQGEEDPYGTMAQIDDITPAGPIERLKLAHCGHSPQRDQPEAVLSALAAFLARHDC